MSNSLDAKLVAPYAGSVEGWFSLDDMRFYTYAYDQLPDNCHIVEIGSWKGRSSSHMATMIANGNKQVKFDCIDIWDGTIGHQANTNIEDQDVLKMYNTFLGNKLYNLFLKNMKPVEGHYTPIRAASLDAVKQYADSSLDFVFIDAAHDYDNVRADIIAWSPKVKPGGMLSGHDYQDPDVKRAISELIGPVDVIGYCWYIKT